MDPFVRDVSTWAAFIAGLLSFLSPCILPIVPSYMLFISGTSAGTMTTDPIEKAKLQKKTIISSLFFIAGFSLVFITLGATATSLGKLLQSQLDMIRIIGGIIVIVLGLHMMGVFQIKQLLYEKRFHFKTRPPGYLGASLIGVAFAAGWTPCIGPTLAPILVLAGTNDSVGKGVFLLSVYSLGLAIPFFLTAIFMDKLFVQFRKIQKHMQKITIGSGAFLVVVGILIITNLFQVIANLFV